MAQPAPSRFADLLRRAERERDAAPAPEIGAARAAARLVVVLREHCADEAELGLVASALLDLLVQTGAEVRAMLAAEIGRIGQAPRELVERLAHDDDPAVAEGVILASPVLDDDALLRIVRDRAVRHRVAVATRPRLGDAVATALSRSGEESVLLALAANADTDLSRPVIAYLAAEAARFPGLAAPLVSRRDLPPDIAEELVGWVTEVAVEEAVGAGVSGRVAMDAGRRAARRVLGAPGRDAIEALAARAVEAAAEAGRLDARFLRDAFAGGQVAAGIAALARLAQVTPAEVKACQAARDGARLARICGAAGLDGAGTELVAAALGLTRRAAAPGEEVVWLSGARPRRG